LFSLKIYRSKERNFTASCFSFAPKNAVSFHFCRKTDQSDKWITLPFALKHFAFRHAPQNMVNLQAKNAP